MSRSGSDGGGGSGRRPRPSNTNPFASDGGGGRGSNPFDDGGGGGGGRRTTPRGGSSSNPFDDGGGNGGGGGGGGRRPPPSGGGSGTRRGPNPFDEDSSGRQQQQQQPPMSKSKQSRPQPVTRRSKTETGGGGGPSPRASPGRGGGGGGGGANPFEFDAEFEMQKSNQSRAARGGGGGSGSNSGGGGGGGPRKLLGRAGGGGGRNSGNSGQDDPASRAILTGMDGADDDLPRQQGGRNQRPANLSRTGRSATHTGSGSGHHPGDAYEQTQAFVAGVQDARGNLTNWLKRNKAEDGEIDHHAASGTGGGYSEYVEPKPWEENDYDDGGGGPTSPAMAQDEPRRGKGGKGRKGKGSKHHGGSGDRDGNIQRWPYDNHHLEQERYYEQMRESNAAAVGGNTNPFDDGDDDDDDDYGDEKKSNGHHHEPSQPIMSESSYFERPQELPTIKEAVQSLNLIEFEKKAEERAIGIVSTWLYDAGLIDELLVNGAVGPALLEDATPGAGAAEGGGPGEAQGIEVGIHGTPLSATATEGVRKMDKEIDKLRASAQRELSLINARLNDGVAASGAEVQELVNAVTATKSDLGRLRELCTYITDSASGGKSNKGGAGAAASSSSSDTRDEFILTRYPRLKAAINARRNLFRCFRELEFFAHIPSTCDRLRDELHSGEWTADEWNTIRNVCMEHVELEILLVEAEAGMKAMFLDEQEEMRRGGGGRRGGARGQRAPPASSRKLRQQMRQKSIRPGGGGVGGGFDSFEMVDKFLSQHVDNVWELGDEIRMRILSGISSSFDLALNNPAGMVALVEAVEVYERAAEQYKSMQEDDEEGGGSGGMDLRNQRLHFTDMRAAALGKIYEEFELRGLEVFRAIHMQAADTADDEEGLNAQFTAVLRAATELVAEIELVKSDIAPCFAPHWAIEVLWSACVAHVCSNQIIQQIGGPDGHALPDLTVTQLLDLIAWVEFFRETVEEMFPSIANMHATQKAADFEEKPDLFAGDGKQVDMDSATDNLAWVNNMLWEVHRLAQEEFLVRTRDQTEKWLANVYEADHAKNQSQDGKLTTSLCEDVFSMAEVQLRTIRERLSKKSEALVMSNVVVFSQMRSKQVHARDGFLQDLETCCAASNDFTRMSEKCEEALQELVEECEFKEEDIESLELASNELLKVYSEDAVYAAQSVHIYIFEPIREAIVDELFGTEWEENLTHNELALTLTRTLEDFMGDLEQFIDDFMLKKAVDSLMSASVVFYVKCLLETAEKHKSNKDPYFGSNSIALERISGDIKAMREYFEGLVEDMPALRKVIEKEFEILTTIHELMSIAAEISDSDASDFILVLHKRIRDLDLTKHAVGDLWHLMNPSQERAVWELVESMEDTLLAVVPHDDSLARQALDRSQVSGLRLDEMMAMHYIESKRKRPVKAGAVEKMVTNWKANWTTEDGEGDQQYEG